jgi:hypothetical protein
MELPTPPSDHIPLPAVLFISRPWPHQLAGPRTGANHLLTSALADIAQAAQARRHNGGSIDRRTRQWPGRPTGSLPLAALNAVPRSLGNLMQINDVSGADLLG